MSPAAALLIGKNVYTHPAMFNHNKQISPKACVQKKIKTAINESYNGKLDQFNYYIQKTSNN